MIQTSNARNSDTQSPSRPDPMLRAMLYYLVSYRRERSVNIIKIYPHPCPPMNMTGMMMMTGRVELVCWVPGVNIDAMDRY